MAVWRYDDPSNRKRLFMVGFHYELGQAAREFKWPDHAYSEDTVPTARCIAVGDGDVPKQYWRRDKIAITAGIENEGVDHKLRFIARSGVGMGPSWLPHAVLSWSGLLNGQTELNGGGGRPALYWQPDQVLDRTRLLVPIETGRAASVSSDYIEFASKHSTGD